MTAYDITVAFQLIISEFGAWVTWARTHGISITIGENSLTASFLSIALAVAVSLMILGYIAPFDEQETDDE